MVFFCSQKGIFKKIARPPPLIPSEIGEVDFVSLESSIYVMDIERVFNIVDTVDVTLATDDEVKDEPDDIETIQH